MKLLLAAGDFSSSREFLSVYSTALKKEFPDWEIRTIGYITNNDNLEISWNLNSIFSPVFGSENKEQIEKDLISFYPDLILNCGEKNVTQLAKKQKWNTLHCGGFELLNHSEFCVKKQIPNVIRSIKEKDGKILPLSFWPFLLKKDSTSCVFPLLKFKQIESEKSYYFSQPEIKDKLQCLPKAEEKIFISDGSTSDLHHAFSYKFKKIFIFPIITDPDSVCNTFIMEKFNLGRQWRGEKEINFESLPEIDYDQLNLISDGKNIIDYLKEKYSSENNG